MFTFFTDPLQWLRRQGIDATIEPHTGNTRHGAGQCAPTLSMRTNAAGVRSR